MCEKIIRLDYSNMDSVIICVKKVFLKARTHVLKFRELFPELSLPPQPILNRSETWLEAASFFADNFNPIKSVILSSNESSAKSI
jgi:hypothetical protein